MKGLKWNKPISVWVLSALAALCLGACVATESSDMSVDMAGNGTGRTGSMACFQVVGEHLYALSGNTLQVYGIADPKALTFHNSVRVGDGIETLFARGEYLYIGSQTGMFVYDIRDRLMPRQSSQVTHMRACDPVVVEDSIAYVTLRSGGSRCWSTANELQIIDVRNAYQPIKLKTYPMANPHGLGVDGDKLFICDGYAGLKVYQVGIDYSLALIDRVDGLETYDVIPATGSGQNLMLIAKDGLYQYDYSGIPMRELSKIPIGE